MRIASLATFTSLLLFAGCPGCPPTSPDAGVDAGADDAGVPSDAGDVDDGGAPDDGGGEPECDENTEGFGDACAAQEGDPLCGQFLCCTPDIPFCAEGQLLWCYDLGPNDCGGCGDLDTSEGRIGEGCGEFGCGVVECGDGGTKTECIGDHPPNQCGGCADITVDAGPGDICSTCLSGEQTCTRDLDDLVCWRGREPDSACGGCDRCIIAHAFMDERFNGGYVRTGTIAIFEDVGDGTRHLVFDPLVEGPGTNGLPWTQVYLSDTQDPTMGAPLLLGPPFAEASVGVTADPVRSYLLSSSVNPETYPYVVLYDLYLGAVISVGQILPGAPPGYPVDGPDGGVVSPDAGPADGGNDDGGASPDGGAAGDAGNPTDGGASSDGGASVDGGATDGGASVDGGASDAGVVDGG